MFTEAMKFLYSVHHLLGIHINWVKSHWLRPLFSVSVPENKLSSKADLKEGSQTHCLHQIDGKISRIKTVLMMAQQNKSSFTDFHSLILEGTTGFRVRVDGHTWWNPDTTDRQQKQLIKCFLCIMVFGITPPLWCLSKDTNIGKRDLLRSWLIGNITVTENTNLSTPPDNKLHHLTLSRLLALVHALKPPQEREEEK